MAWSREEVDQTIPVYFKMFKQQLRGKEFVKAEYHRDLASRLGRKESAVALKFHNVSAILAELEYPHMRGYSPQSHYQKLLKVRVREFLAQEEELHDLLGEEATGRPEKLQVPASPEDILGPPPEKEDSSSPSRDTSSRFAKQINYVERERRNRNLGKAGEEYVVEFEQKRLRQGGHPELADRVEWVADTRGDGLGYDVLSFENDGEERYVEVKTTKQGKSLPFYLTVSELEFSQEVEDQFYLYRLYDFGGGGEPSLYVLNGPMDDTCNLSPKSFRAVPYVEEG